MACVLVLDTSASMGGECIDHLNEGFRALCDELNDDALARKRIEVAVVTFGGQASLALGFREGRDLEPVTFQALGAPVLGAALALGVQLVLTRKGSYQRVGLEYYRPWVFVLSQGPPTDRERLATVAEQVRAAEARRSLAVFAVGIGDADVESLATISAARQPVKLQQLRFVELFRWLSACMSVVSTSTAAASDAELASYQATDETLLPSPATWAEW